MTITKFDKATSRAFGLEAAAALAALAEKYGVTVAYRGGSFDDGSFMMKIKAIVAGGKTADETNKQDSFKQLAQFYDLQADDLGKSFVHGGKTLTIYGLNTRSKKKPVILQDARGAMYSGTIAFVKTALGR